MDTKKLFGITLGANLVMCCAVGAIVGYVTFNALDKEIKDLKNEVSELKGGYGFASKGGCC